MGIYFGWYFFSIHFGIIIYLLIKYNNELVSILHSSSTNCLMVLECAVIKIWLTFTVSWHQFECPLLVTLYQLNEAQHCTDHPYNPFFKDKSWWFIFLFAFLFIVTFSSMKEHVINKFPFFIQVLSVASIPIFIVMKGRHLWAEISNLFKCNGFLKFPAVLNWDALLQQCTIHKFSNFS